MSPSCTRLPDAPPAAPPATPPARLVAVAAGVHSQRVVLLSGTPYNNNKNDLATMCAFIDPSLEAARRQFWEKALERDPQIVDRHRAWLAAYLLHRTKEQVLKGVLKGKQRETRTVVLSAGEVRNYEPMADQLMVTLKNLLNAMKRTAKSPAARQRKQRDIRRLSKRFLGQSQECRQVLVHPALAGKGRELTRLFTRTRCDKEEPAVTKASKLSCACCNPGYGAASVEEEEEEDADEREERVGGTEDDGEDLRDFIVQDGEGEETEDEDEDEEQEAAREMEADESSDEEDQDQDEGQIGGGHKGGGVETGPSDGAPSQRWQGYTPADSCGCGRCLRGPPAANLVELPPEACGAVDGMRHRVHACCLAECTPAKGWTDEEKAANYPSCPRCRLLRRRLHLGVGSRAEEADGVAADELTTGESCEMAKPQAATQGGGDEEEGGGEDEEGGSGGDEEEGGGDDEEESDVWIGKDVADANGRSLGGLRLSSKLLELRRLLQATPLHRRARCTAAPLHCCTAALLHCCTSTAGNARRRQDARVLVLQGRPRRGRGAAAAPRHRL